jgi:hypothetical protein
MDLTTLQTRLKDKEHYETISDWVQDFFLIFDNAIQFDQDSSIVSSVARFFKAKLQKQIDRITGTSDAEYTARLGTAVARYSDLLSRPPSSASPEPPCPRVEDLGGLFDEYSLNLLSQKLNRLARAGKAAEMAGFFGEVTDDGTPVEIDLGVLSEDKIKSLWAFVRERETP